MRRYNHVYPSDPMTQTDFDTLTMTDQGTAAALGMGILPLEAVLQLRLEAARRAIRNNQGGRP